MCCLIGLGQPLLPQNPGHHLHQVAVLRESISMCERQGKDQLGSPATAGSDRTKTPREDMPSQMRAAKRVCHGGVIRCSRLVVILTVRANGSGLLGSGARKCAWEARRGRHPNARHAPHSLNSQRWAMPAAAAERPILGLHTVPRVLGHVRHLLLLQYRATLSVTHPSCGRHYRSGSRPEPRSGGAPGSANQSDP